MYARRRLSFTVFIIKLNTMLNNEERKSHFLTYKDK